MAKKSSSMQLVWGFALALAGLGVFFRIPQVMPQIEQIEQFASASWFIRFCFYVMGILLLGGGVKKIYAHWPRSGSRDSQ